MLESITAQCGQGQLQGHAGELWDENNTRRSISSIPSWAPWNSRAANQNAWIYYCSPWPKAVCFLVGYFRGKDNGENISWRNGNQSAANNSPPLTGFNLLSSKSGNLDAFAAKMTLPMLRLLSSKEKECIDFWKTSKPCRVGINCIPLIEYSQMSTHVPVFHSFWSVFLHRLYYLN